MEGIFTLHLRVTSLGGLPLIVQSDYNSILAKLRDQQP